MKEEPLKLAKVTGKMRPTIHSHLLKKTWIPYKKGQAPCDALGQLCNESAKIHVT
jgi:hypothetical protein